MFIECCCDNIEGMEPGLFDLVVPLSHGQPRCILDGVLCKDHPQRVAERVCFLQVRVQFKEYPGSFLLPVRPLVGRLEELVSAPCQQLLPRVTVLIAQRDVPAAFKPCILHLIIGLLYGIPTVLDSHFLDGIAGKFLDMEAVDDTPGFWEGAADYLAHRVGQVKGYLRNRLTFLFRYRLQGLDDILRLRT